MGSKEKIRDNRKRKEEEKQQKDFFEDFKNNYHKTNITMEPVLLIDADPQRDLTSKKLIFFDKTILHHNEGGLLHYLILH